MFGELIVNKEASLEPRKPDEISRTAAESSSSGAYCWSAAVHFGPGRYSGSQKQGAQTLFFQVFQHATGDVPEGLVDGIVPKIWQKLPGGDALSSQ